MIYYALFFAALFFSFQGLADTALACSKWPKWFQKSCIRFHQILNEGTADLYVSGYSWHNRFTYSEQRIKNYNEVAWGGGLGKSFFDEDGDWHSLAAIVFLESHAKWEPTAGYTFLKVANLSETVKIGGGFSIVVTMRPDINNGYPFPGILPWASIFYRKVALSVTYIPGTHNNGNVLYVLGKISLDL
jgi:palmitoyl transferase